MPPKGSRGGRGGRGRGRTNAAATSGSSRDDLQTEAQSANTNTTTPPKGLDPIPDLSRPSSSTFISPNSSPASAPTETPAPTPVRVPVQRLDSLTRGGARGGRAGATAPSSSRFKPKAVRRTVEDREKAAREEAERNAARAKDAAALEKLANRGRGRGRGRGEGMRGRGRGDAMGMRGRAVASGPFAAAPASDKKSGGFVGTTRSTLGGSSSHGVRSGGGGGGSGVSGQTSGRGIKREDGGMSHYTSTRTAEDGTFIKDEGLAEPIYPEDQEEGGDLPRINIERINLVTDDEESADEGPSNRKGKATAKTRKGGLRPVRLQREEHKNRVQMVNTEPAVNSLPKEEEDPIPQGDEEDGAAMDGVLSQERARQHAQERKDHRWSGVWRDDDTPVIKPDPDASITLTGGDIMEIDSGDNTPAPTSGVDFKLPPQRLDNEVAVSGSVEAGPKKSKTKRASSTKDRKPVLQTEEDKAEYERHIQDVKILAHELGGFQSAVGSEGAAGDVDEDSDMDKPGVDLDGRLYLFQFPPILPPLYNPIKKEEPGAGDVEMSDVTAVPEAGASSAAVDLTKPDSDEAVEVKPEPGVFMAPRETIPEPGFVGKLVVRQSGKVELDWGGTSLQLEKGAVFDFFASTMVIDGPEETTEAEAQGYGEADGRKGYGTGMGQVMGKFVLTPNWDKLFERGG